MCVACNTAKNVVGKVVGVVPKRKGRKGKITILDSTTLKVVVPLLLSLSHTHHTHTQEVVGDFEDVVPVNNHHEFLR